MHRTKRRRLDLRLDRIRELTLPELRLAAGGRRGDPITPQCPSEYTTCPNSCSQ